MTLCCLFICSLRFVSLLNRLSQILHAFLLDGLASFCLWLHSICVFRTTFDVVLKPHLSHENLVLMIVGFWWMVSLCFVSSEMELVLNSQSSQFRLDQFSEERRKRDCSMILKMRKVLDWSELVLLSVINSIYFYWTCHLTLDKVMYANLGSYRFHSLNLYPIYAKQWDFGFGNVEVQALFEPRAFSYDVLSF